ncbi:hypothetical protein PFICI_00643 [Pestalotiopsis fici W106-1]|uniref:Heme haloperoxidase family profile domain-containing protein n=1 Tax=Pestalotiopsis fici (strain W106-1 / CGMCC3.15140) TaxID=1229662 RepID=W3XLG4_PESFW|nr:uncharacterized protein PFICI_00643 [Pestalotiopsis fici W106-1]ETS86815.1 hypothetical protein PFICI_00643 [Pestalotiopsis fici W106-1]
MTYGSLSSILGQPDISWLPPGPNDLRGPCPMLNTLANHGFLQHDGTNITLDNMIAALSMALNFDPKLSSLMFDQAIVANPDPNATFFTLDQLNRHNILEHDASLSRSDAYFGNNHIFNQTIFDSTKVYWTAEVLTPQMLANSKIFRQIQSRAFNPDYSFSPMNEEFSLGEVAAPILVFGNMRTGEVNRSLVEYFYERERLPTALGWVKNADVIGLPNVLATTQLIRNAMDLLTGFNGAVEHRDLHAGPFAGQD